MGRQMRYITYNIPSNRAVKRSLDCHKTLNRAHLGSSNDGVSFDGILFNGIIFDVYLTLALHNGISGLSVCFPYRMLNPLNWNMTSRNIPFRVFSERVYLPKS
jgi:hypothetical protein